MGRLIYSVIASLDGYVADADGGFDWAVPDAEVHGFVNDLQEPVRTHLYGRRLYETMRAWETLDAGPGQDPAVARFARLWRAADKVVYSRTLPSVSTARTRIERSVDPVEVRGLVDAAEGDVTVGGPALAATAITAGLVDEWHLFLVPVVVGGGLPVFPGGVRIDLELREERRFGNGTVFLRHRSRRG